MALLAASSLYLASRPSPFARAFDENLARFPLAASLARRDPELRTIFLHRTEQAFNAGGWRAANAALRSSLASEVEVYADAAHINAISRAELPMLLALESRPDRCKSYLLAGAEPGEFPEAIQAIERLSAAQRAAIESGFDRRASGVEGTKPGDEEVIDVAVRLSGGPVEKLTQAELGAEAAYLDGDAQLLCSASLKKLENLLALEDAEAAEAKRIMMATLGRIDFARVISRLCRAKDSGLTCP